MTEKDKDKEDILLFLKTVSKPIWYPAVMLGRFFKEVGKEFVDSARKDKTGELVGIFFCFGGLTCLVAVILSLISFWFFKIWLVGIIGLYLTAFYIRDSYKRKNK